VRATFCRRLARCRRLSLHSARGSKSNYKDESEDSFSHERERKQTAAFRSTHFSEQAKYLTLRFMGVSVEPALRIQNAANPLDFESSPKDESVRMADFR
jgi:hypothetical protein